MEPNRQKLETPDALARYRKALQAAPQENRVTVRVCCGSGCAPKGAQRVYERFCEAAEHGRVRGITVTVKATGCQGLCELGPLVTVDPGEVFYTQVREEDVPEIFRETVLNGRVVDRLLYHDGSRRVLRMADVPFYRGQVRVAMALCGQVDPESIDDYIAAGGYAALAKALTTMTPDAVIEEIVRSGLRGRGGGGFLTGRKWRAAREARGDPKYVVANGDEGDPGAFMDRALMEGVPHVILEGMIIGAYALGASRGYIYVRHEYPMAVDRLTQAIAQARALGLLGHNILGRGLDFDIRICRGAGAFVCGESTALMASLEGRVGEPRAKYIHTVESGVWGKPFLLNNVETWANVPPIILRGGAWFASMGTEHSKGTKMFSLVGKADTGEVEISPFKARVKLSRCRACGASMIPETVRARILERLRAGGIEFRGVTGLCPACRRRQAAAAWQHSNGR